MFHGYIASDSNNSIPRIQKCEDYKAAYRNRRTANVSQASHHRAAPSPRHHHPHYVHRPQHHTCHTYKKADNCRPCTYSVIRRAPTRSRIRFLPLPQLGQLTFQLVDAPRLLPYNEFQQSCIQILSTIGIPHTRSVRVPRLISTTSPCTSAPYRHVSRIVQCRVGSNRATRLSGSHPTQRLSHVEPRRRVNGLCAGIQPRAVLPTRHTTFDALVTNQRHVQPGTAENLQRRFTRAVSSHTFAFEIVRIPDATVVHAFHGGQRFQVFDLTYAEHAASRRCPIPHIPSLISDSPTRWAGRTTVCGVRPDESAKGWSNGLSPSDHPRQFQLSVKHRFRRHPTVNVVQPRSACLTLRDFMYTVTPAPAISRPSTVNSIVPAAPVNGSWVMFVMFCTVIAPLVSSWVTRS